MEAIGYTFLGTVEGVELGAEVEAAEAAGWVGSSLISVDIVA